MPLCWGIIGTGKICNDFVQAVQSLKETEHKIVAVASRSRERALNFATTHNLVPYYAYHELASVSCIDIVYVGCLNNEHFEVSKLMLESGKHVLCEKPLTMNEKQTRELVEIARKCKKFLMEAVWSRSFPAYDMLRKILNKKQIGNVIQVNTTLGFNLHGVERLKRKDLGGGTILDLGVYCLQLQQLVFNGEPPTQLVAVGGLTTDGVDEYVSAIWKYSHDKMGCMTTSAKAKYPNEAVIIGTLGIIRIPDFWCPTELIINGVSNHFKLPKTSKTFNFHNSIGLTYQAEHVRQCLLERKIESPNITHDESIQLAHLMDMIRREMGVVFLEDSE